MTENIFNTVDDSNLYESNDNNKLHEDSTKAENNPQISHVNNQEIEVEQDTSRYGAWLATKDFPIGTVGYGVHQAIDLLHNGLEVPLFDGIGGLENWGDAEI